MNLFREAEGFKSVCIAGMSKNAGKTTVLNAFLDAFHAHGVGVAVTSIGRDGESNDVVFDVAKPEVFLKKGDIAAHSPCLRRLFPENIPQIPAKPPDRPRNYTQKSISCG